MAKPTILLTGFEPFEGAPSNPSWALAQAFHGHTIAGARVQAQQLPCAFGHALDVVRAALRTHQPQLVLALGLAAGRAEMSVERVAINVDDARIADNLGAQPIDSPVVAKGPAAYFSTLPIKAMVGSMQRAGVPAAVSQTAGTFVCNHVFYGLMHLLRRKRGVRAGFMHVPLFLDDTWAAGSSGLSWETQRQGVELALDTAWNTAEDEQATGGAIF